jgi:hypothetical protein
MKLSYYYYYYGVWYVMLYSILLDFIISEEYKLQNSSFCSFFQPSVTLPLSIPNVLLSTFFYTLNLFHP